jgi:hypothetical protein
MRNLARVLLVILIALVGFVAILLQVVRVLKRAGRQDLVDAIHVALARVGLLHPLETSVRRGFEAIAAGLADDSHAGSGGISGHVEMQAHSGSWGASGMDYGVIQQ